MKTNIFNSKRFLSLFLALVMVIGMLPMSAITANAAASEAVAWDNQTETYNYTAGMTLYYKYDNYLYKAVFTNLKNITSVGLYRIHASGEIALSYNGDLITRFSTTAGSDNIATVGSLPKQAEASVSYYLLQSPANVYSADANSPVVTVTCIGVGDPVWSWNGTSSATAKFTSVDGNATITVAAEIAGETIYTAVKCTETDTIKYTATATCNGLQYTDTSEGTGAAGPHAYGYTASGTTITEICTNNCGHTGTVTLSANDKTYDTTAYNGAKVEKNNFVSALSITYEGTGNTTYAKSETPPTEIGTYKVTATAQDGTTSVSAEFAITFIPVTGLGKVPNAVILNQAVTLPTALPANASYRTVKWEVLSGTASISNGVFIGTGAGTVKIRATIEHGKAYGTPYTEEFTITVQSLTDNQLDISQSNITISKENETQLRVTHSGYTGGYKIINNSELITITGTSSANRVIVESGAVANIVLNGCIISNSSYMQHPFVIHSGAKVNLTLVGENSIMQTNGGAGIYVPSGAELTIDGEGSLTAQANNQGAAIGGSYSESAGTITINGGTITATATSGAGIGGGANGGAGGNITINGGIVTATAVGGAGIGGGEKGSAGNITINGGTIIATANEIWTGAGIGSGKGGSGGAVTITGGTITASSTWGAGIGSGRQGSNVTVNITGGNIKASSGQAAAIGAGYGGSNVTVSDDSNNSVAKQIITLEGVTQQVAVTAIDGISYGCNDMYTLDTNKLYLYLSGDLPTSITAGGNTYYRSGTSKNYVLHQHSFTYQKVEGENKIVATCGAANCPNTNGGYVTVTVPTDAQIHTGNAIKPAVVTYSTDWQPADKPEMVYTNNTNLGTATGTLELGNAKIEVTFDIVAEIKLDANGGTCSTTSILTDKEGKLTADLPTNVTHSSLFFNGWYDAQTDGNAVTNDTQFTGSTTIYAQFVAHQHNWIYAKDGDNKIVATCSNEDTYCSDTNGGYVTIAAPTDLTYTGSYIEAVVDNQITTGDKVAVQYKYAQASDRNFNDDKPYNVGTYTARVSVGGQEISVTYDIEPASIKDAVVNAPNQTYTGSALEPEWLDVTLDEKSLNYGTDYTVTYENNTDVGEATVIVKGTGNYTGEARGTFTIRYLDTDVIATVSGTQGANGWYTGEVTLDAPDRYTISKTANGEYASSVSYNAEQNETVTYYLKNESGQIAQKTLALKIDLAAPTAEYNVKSSGWRKFVNFITFGIFCKDNADLEIRATDTMDSSVTVEYYISSTEISDASTINGWNPYTEKVALNPKAKNYIYIRVTDEAGHSVIYESGVVVFTDSEAETETITFTKTSTDDVTATVVLNNNTVKTIYNGETELTKDTHYSVENGTITFKASYLDTLAAGDYTLTVHYNPLGENYVDKSDDIANEAPATTTIALQVVKAEGFVKNITVDQGNYDGTSIDDSEVHFDTNNTGAVTIEFKDPHTGDILSSAPIEAGRYIVCVTVAADENYEQAYEEKSITLETVSMTNVSVVQNGTLTYTGEPLTATVTTNATTVGNNAVTFTYSKTPYEGEDDKFTAAMPTFTDAGTYTVYFIATAPNHNVYPGTFTVKIDKATVTVPTIASKPYTGEPQTADVPANDLYEVVTNNGETDKGSYAVVLKLTDSKNYKWSTDTTGAAETVTLAFTITAAENSWVSKPDIKDKGWTYGETAKEPTYEAKFGTVSVKYTGTAYDGTTWNNANAPTKAGEYTATFTVEGTADYTALEESVDFTIAKKKVTVTADDASKTYGENDPALTYTNTDLVGNDALTGITVTRASGENADTYTITASQTDGANPNYDITFVSGTFTINKAVLAVTADDVTATYGDAVPNYTVEYNGFVNGDDKDDLGGTLAFYCNYKQFSNKGEYKIEPHGLKSDNYVIGYNFGTLTVSAKPITVTIQAATSIYGEALADLKATDDGIVNGDTDVYSLATTATSTSNAGKYAITGTAKDGNYSITFANEADAYEITKREITITVDAKNVVVNTALPTYTYTVDNLFGEDKLTNEPTITCNADIAVIGEYDITASGADAGSNYTIKYVPAKLSVLTDNAVDAAKGYEEELENYDPAKVTSEDKTELTEMLNEINTILADETTTDNGKKALEEVKEQVEALIQAIDDAAKATDTENTEKVENVTPENVTPENKTDLESAKEDLEKALTDHGSNMTEDEKKAVEDEIKRIDEALEVIGNVENVEGLIDKLPDTIKKDDEAAIKAAEEAYNALSDYEKSLVDKDVKKALDDAKVALAELNKPADSNSPNTGDNSNMFLWIALLFISGGAVITLTVVDRKKRAVKTK